MQNRWEDAVWDELQAEDMQEDDIQEDDIQEDDIQEEVAPPAENTSAANSFYPYDIVKQPEHVGAPEPMRATWKPREDGFELVIPHQRDTIDRVLTYIMGVGWIVSVVAILLKIASRDYDKIGFLFVIALTFPVALYLTYLDWSTKMTLTLEGDLLKIVETSPRKTTTHYEGPVLDIKAVCKERTVTNARDSVGILYYIDILGLDMEPDVAKASDASEFLYLCQEMNRYFLTQSW